VSWAYAAESVTTGGGEPEFMRFERETRVYGEMLGVQLGKIEWIKRAQEADNLWSLLASRIWQEISAGGA